MQTRWRETNQCGREEDTEHGAHKLQNKVAAGCRWPEK